LGCFWSKTTSDYFKIPFDALDVLPKFYESMKSFLAPLFALCLGAIIVSGTTNAAPLITTNYFTQTFTNNVGSSGYTFDFAKYNQTLGELLGVTFTVVSSIDSGSFVVQNNAQTSATVRNPFDSLTVIDRQLSGADYFGNNITLLTSPGTTGAGNSLDANSIRTYTITNSPILADNVITDIGSSFWSSYSSANGSGLVSFNATIAPNATVSGGDFSLNAAGMSANTVLSLSYAYAVPEPSTYILFGLGGLALVVAYRRKRTA